MKGMYYILIITGIMLMIGIPAQAIEGEDGKQVVPKRFKDVMTGDDTKDIVRLHDFLQDKDNQYAKLRSEYETASRFVSPVPLSDSGNLQSALNQLNEYMDKNPDAVTVSKTAVPRQLSVLLERYTGKPVQYMATSPPETTFDLGTIKYNISYFLNQISVAKDNAQRAENLKQSIENVESDRQSALRAIQQIFNVESGNQKFKREMGIIFSALILILLSLFFWFLYRKSDATIGNIFLSGNGIQFVTLFAIIISTILFGILGILEGRELAAILSGIAGFILGKGITPVAARHEEVRGGGEAQQHEE